MFQKHVRMPMLRATLRAEVTSVSHCLIPCITCLLICFATFQARVQRVLQPDPTFFEDSETVIRTTIKKSLTKMELFRPNVRTTKKRRVDKKCVRCHAMEVSDAMFGNHPCFNFNVDGSFSESSCFLKKPSRDVELPQLSAKLRK